MVGLRFVKDEVQRVDGVLNVKITRELMDDVKNSHIKYDADHKQRQELKEKELADDIIIEAKDSLQNVLKSTDSNKLSRNVIQSATAKIEIGVDRKRKLEADMEELKKSKEKLLKKNRK